MICSDAQYEVQCWVIFSFLKEFDALLQSPVGFIYILLLRNLWDDAPSGESHCIDCSKAGLAMNHC